MTRFTFKKNERLTSKKTFEALFHSGKSFTVAPFRLVYLPAVPSSSQAQSGSQRPSVPVQLGISVPKRSFPRAVDRNTLKRRIREAYRKNKHLLYEILKKENHSRDLMIIYISKEKLPYAEINKKMIVSLQRLAEQKHS